jgi:hypothetical protein
MAPKTMARMARTTTATDGMLHPTIRSQLRLLFEVPKMPARMLSSQIAPLMIAMVSDRLAMRLLLTGGDVLAGAGD